MDLQIQKEKINIKKKIGEKNKKIVIEKDVILPDSKPDIIKIQNESSNAYITKKENMENKIKIDGGVATRISYLTGEGKCRVLKIEESFSEVLEIQGVTEETYINDSLNIRNANVTILNERKIHYKVEIDCMVKASKKEEVEYIYEINKSHNLQTLTQKRRIDTFVGHGESKLSVKEKMEIENLQESIEVVQMTHRIVNIEKKISYNKVLIKADCEMKCLYQTENGHIYVAKKNVPLMGFLDIENVEESNYVNTEFNLKNINITENENDIKPGIDIEMEINMIGDVYDSKDINMINDLYDLNYKTEFSKQKVMLENSSTVPSQTATINQKTVVQDINQVYNAEYQIINTRTNGRELELEIQATYLYSSFENQTINRKNETFSQTIQLEKNLTEVSARIMQNSTNVLPDSSINTELSINIYNQSSSQIEIINEIKINDEENDEGYSMIIYFVKPGDSLWKIAKRFKSTIREISNLNEIANEDKINVGDKLYIPRAI